MDKEALITVTCLAAALGTLLSAFLANMPIALAPAVGLNSFFAYSIVKGQGVPWEIALGVVFLSGLFYIILTFTGIRKQIANAIPRPISLAASVGIGLFITFIGLRSMKIIVASPATLVALGDFTPEVALSLFGLFLMILFDAKKVSGGILFSIIITTIIGIILGMISLPTSLIAMPPSIAPIAMKLDIMGALQWSLAGAIFSFLFIDLFNSLAFIIACGKEIGLEDSEGRIKDIDKMLYADSIATISGAMMGTSTISTFSESTVGIAAGARTGLASVATGVLFILALFFTPIVTIVPLFIAAPALVMVGVYMFRNIVHMDFSDMKIAVPSFLTIVMMPLSYNIVIGLSFGFISYIMMHVIDKDFKKIPPILWIIGILSVVFLLVA
jgi:AGZA family xanthine/uracil permease-like MFS transporter